MAATASPSSFERLFHFYSPPIKITSPVNFQTRFGNVVSSSAAEAQGILRELSQQREAVLVLFERPLSQSHEDPLTIANEVAKYLGLLGGLSGGAVDLKGAIKFVWTNTFGEAASEARSDSSFEYLSILMCQALWLLRYSAAYAGATPALTEEDQKWLYARLLEAYSILEFVETQNSTLTVTPIPVDMEGRVLGGFRSLALAQAQEITVKRAISKQHNDRLIAKLCVDLKNKYTSGSSLLSSFGGKGDAKVAKLKAYLDYKAAVYGSFAYYYTGKVQWGGELRGPAIRCADEAKTLFESGAAAAKVYCREAPRTSAEALPQDSVFQTNLAESRKEWVRENDFIYFAKVPEEAPNLPEPQSLLTLPVYDRVPTNGVWTAAVYAAFDGSKITIDTTESELPTTSGGASTSERGCTIL